MVIEYVFSSMTPSHACGLLYTNARVRHIKVFGDVHIVPYVHVISYYTKPELPVLPVCLQIQRRQLRRTSASWQTDAVHELPA